MDHSSSEVQEQHGQHGETPSLQKILNTKYKTNSQMWWCMPIVPATQEAEMGVLLGFETIASHDHTSALQPE